MKRTLDRVNIYPDGSCDPNPGKGGWGSVIRYQDYGEDVEIGEAYRFTTNNRMELLAVIKSIEWLEWPCKIRVYTDSKYIVNAVNWWMDGWIKNNWYKSSGEPVKNADLWKQLLPLIKYHDFKIFWIKGHNGHKDNERADELATFHQANGESFIDQGYELSRKVG